MGSGSGGPARTPEWRPMSNLTEAPRPSLLSDQSLSVVQATAPVVAAHADEITARFYPRMFAAHPELLHVFNQGNQATGEQSKALAGSCRIRRSADRPQRAIVRPRNA